MRRVIASLIGVVAFLVVFGGAGQAGAAPIGATATCSGYGCDYQDPIATGCSAGANNTASAAVTYGGVNYGTVELRWSPTCQSNWSRLTINAGSSNPNGYWRGVDVYRQSPYALAYFDYYGTGSQVYGNMLYSPGCAKATAYLQISASATATGVALQPGCSF
jgi:hypothetical protein